jgi:uncharacterized protein
VAPTPAIPLPLRNALAALALRALGDADARAAARWLAAPTGAPLPGVARVLVEIGLADPPGSRLLDLYDPHEPQLRRHAARTLAAVRTFDAGPAPIDPADGALLAAAALWREGLYFEVHEVLEPHWARATGAAREALQGLIQVAVAFHHLTHGNPRGARKLLGDGREKLRLAGTSLPRIDASGLVAATTPWMDALLARGDPPRDPVPCLAVCAAPYPD